MSISHPEKTSHRIAGGSAEQSLPSSGADSHETEAQFRELVSHLQQAFWMKNVADTAVLYVSPAYETIWGRSRASLYDSSHTFLDSVHPDDHARITEAMDAKHQNSGYNEEYRILRPDGTTRWVWARTYPVCGDEGDIQRYAGIAEDITERKWAEKERSRLAAIIEHAEDSIVSITLDGLIIAWNHGAERKYGYTAEEVLGRSIFVLIPPDHTQGYLEAMKKVCRGEPIIAYDTVRRRKDGTLINFAIGIAPIEARDGEIVGVSKISHDLSRVRKLEAELIEAQKMEVVGQLTGGVAHDFNNILAIILGYSELILDDLDADNPARKFAEAIRHAANRGSGLTRQLLVFSRKETVQFTVLDVNDVIAETAGMLRQIINENIEFAVNRCSDLGVVKADVGYVGQVLMNLVINARDAMPHGGKLTVATSNVTLDEQYATAHRGVTCGDYVQLTISDTGLGMSDETKSHVFDPFFTTKPRGLGTGLGLSTCRTIVEQTGGHIALETEQGHGTTFKVYFPRVSVRTETATHYSNTRPLPRGTETLLVVEDDPEVRRLVSVVLHTQGYEVLTAANGEEGLRVAAADDRGAIRLVISDVVMPMMGGEAMAGRLESTRPELKFLFTSGYTDRTTALHGVIDPGVAFLPKPYTIVTLARKVRELLDAPPFKAP